MTELKTKVLELLNYPAEFIKKTNLLYRYTVYTPQEEMKQIILEDPESRINILRHIFGIDKYKKIRENLIILTAKLREESRLLQVEIRDLDENRNKFGSLKEFVKLLNSKINTKREILEERINQRKRIEEEVKKIEFQIKEKEKFEKEIEKTNIMIANKKEHLTKGEKDIQDLEEKVSQTRELFDEALFQQVISQLKNKQNSIEKINKTYIEISGKISSLEMKKEEDLVKKNRIFCDRIENKSLGTIKLSS